MTQPLSSCTDDNPRAQYDEHTKFIVRSKYCLCADPEDKEMLAAEVNITSIQKLYNFSSRLGSTRQHSDTEKGCSNEEVYDAVKDTSRYLMREDMNTPWTPQQERYIKKHYGKTYVESIAFFLNRSETAVAYHARHMGLRRVPKYYDIVKVAAWLGMTEREVLFLLPKHGLEVFPCTDRHQKLKITLVSTTSLARTLLRNRLWKMLVDKRGADMFFISDIIESVVSCQKNENTWEPSPWISHGHTCLNPRSTACFGWFYTTKDKLNAISKDKTEDAMYGEHLDPRDIGPGVEDIKGRHKDARETYVAPVLDRQAVREVSAAAA